MCYVRIEPEDERPESRSDFKYEDLLRHVLENRGRIIADMIIILSAYAQAGSPRVASTKWGSYESWCRIVRDPLVWLSLTDPRQGTIELSNSTVATDPVDDLIHALEVAGIPYDGWSTREIFNRAFQRTDFTHQLENEELNAAINELFEEKKPSVKSLGHKLKKFDGKIFNRKKLVCFFDSHLKINKWRVESAGMRDSGGMSRCLNNVESEVIREKQILGE
jgi:hypothetical protein